MWVGLALTLLATVVPFLAPQVIEDHIRDSYPGYSAGELDDAVNGWLMIIGMLGGLAVVGWGVSIWATLRASRPKLWVSLMGGLGIALFLTAALTPEESGDVGLAPAYGGLLVLPCIAGIAAVTLVWKASAPTTSS
ncbi:hypothetical protein ASG90_18965 [Nocardioides sp. Soil797]|nr:hypothetical protein ASG90_18965 [Nocardioides sp. Soil797]